MWKVGITLAFLIMTAIMGLGLWHSYSRGAWLATLLGLTYLTCQWLRHRKSHTHYSLFVAWLVIILSISILFSWQYRNLGMKYAVIRRVLSVGNINDFSWRNRIAAWIGNLQMMADRPWFGSGWDQTEPQYSNFYVNPKLEESAAIQLNDFLMLGAALGIPALVCFGVYLWLKLGVRARAAADRIVLSEEALDTASLESLQAICRAGAIVMLIGFWFNSGLFKLATASIFWILLELGGMENHVTREGYENG